MWKAATAAATTTTRSRPLATMRRVATPRRHFSVNNKTKPNNNDTTSATKKPTGWLYRMAPPKGGTEPPDATFLAIAFVVCGAGYYAWFVEPPKKAETKMRDESSK